MLTRSIIFRRFTDEVIVDLQTTYEMPAEAVSWVHDMVLYTVDGGKMNRGLATVDVIRTLARREGKTLSVQVSLFLFIFSNVYRLRG